MINNDQEAYHASPCKPMQDSARETTEILSKKMAMYFVITSHITVEITVLSSKTDTQQKYISKNSVSGKRLNVQQ